MIDDMKERIAHHARSLFDRHGFHGAALREVCALAGCKMPTIYYYYGNKEKLFDEVVRVAFEELQQNLWAQLPKDVSSQEYDTLMVIQKKNLSEEERIIYRLAMKTWLGFDGGEETRRGMMAWEQHIYDNSEKKYADVVNTQRGAKFIARHITALIQRIILIDEDVPDDEIRVEVAMIFDAATHSDIKTN